MPKPCDSVADFIGVNKLIAGEVKGIQEAKGWMAVHTRFGLLKCVFDAQFKTGEACNVTVRPEVASFCNSDEVSDETNVIAGTVNTAGMIVGCTWAEVQLTLG